MKPITKFSQLDISKQYSYADYLTWQLKERIELIKGWIYQMSPAPALTHQRVSLNLTLQIAEYVQGNSCNMFVAPFDVRLLDNRKIKSDSKVYTVVQPDLCVICDEKKLDERGCMGAPDLIVEIVSPGNSKKEMKTKFALYEENLVKEYWIIDYQEKYIMQFSLKNKKFLFIKNHFDDDILSSTMFKGLQVNVGKLFKKM